jgi:hypothetical protein
MNTQQTFLILYFVLTCITQSPQPAGLDQAPQPLPPTAPQMQPIGDQSSPQSVEQTYQILNNSQTIIEAIGQSLNSGEASMTLLMPTLQNDTITSTISVTIGDNSTSDEETLSKICNAWQAALTNVSGRIFDNNCTWEQQNSTQKRAAGDSYFGTTFSNSTDTFEPAPQPSPAPGTQPDDGDSSYESKQQTAQILNDAQNITNSIEQSLNPGEASISNFIPTLYNDTITVIMTVTIGQNSTSDEETLSKICDAWKAALTNSSGRIFNDCTWENITSQNIKRAAGNVYLGTTFSNLTNTPYPQSPQPDQQQSPAPSVIPDDENSSVQSKQQAAKILNDAQTIQSAIENSLNPGEAQIGNIQPSLKNDQINVTLTAILGQNSTNSQDTLNKICNAWRTALYNSCGRNFNDCNWEGPLKRKRAAGDIYLGSTISPAPQDQQPGQQNPPDSSSSYQIKVPILSLIIGIGLMIYNQ